MLSFANRLALLATFILLATQTFADDATKSREAVADDLTPQVGKATRGTRLLGVSVRDHDGQKLGKVVDLLVDPYYARVSSLVVKPDSSVDRKRRLLIPTEVVKPDGETLQASRDVKEIENEATSLLSEGNATPYTRRMATATYRHYSLQPYWANRGRKRSTEENVQANVSATRDDQFFLLTKLTKESVLDSAGGKLGHISDVMVSKTDSKIVYVLLETAHETKGREKAQTFAVPLAAFVVPTDSGKWSIDLPEKLLENTQTVENGKLPREINRAWVEYVHVKYGGGIFGGVQRKP